MNIKSAILSILLFLPYFLVAQDGFPLPDVPKTLKGPEVRANYLALHYWDKIDFNDSSIIGNKEIVEQGFSNFISIMPYVGEKEAAFEMLGFRLVTNTKMLQYFLAVGMKYLSEPLSPVYNEELYIMFLNGIVSQQGISERDYEEVVFELGMARKNRIGTKAADFAFLKRDGKLGRLSKVKAEYILLFLGDPECDVCAEVKEDIKSSEVVASFIDNGRLKVLSVCVEGNTDAWRQTALPSTWIDACDDKQVIYSDLLYDIPGLPVLYLLDKEHNVVMKNVPLSYIELFLEKIM